MLFILICDKLLCLAKLLIHNPAQQPPINFFPSILQNKLISSINKQINSSQEIEHKYKIFCEDLQKFVKSWSQEVYEGSSENNLNDNSIQCSLIDLLNCQIQMKELVQILQEKNLIQYSKIYFGRIEVAAKLDINLNQQLIIILNYINCHNKENSVVFNDVMQIGSKKNQTEAFDLEIINKKDRGKEEEKENMQKNEQGMKLGIKCVACDLPITYFSHGQCTGCQQWFHYSCQSTYESKVDILLYWWCLQCQEEDYYKKFMKIQSTHRIKEIREEQLKVYVQSLRSNEQQKEKKNEMLCEQCKDPLSILPHRQCVYCSKQFHTSCQSKYQSRKDKVLYWWCDRCKENDQHKQFMNIVFRNKNQEIRDQLLVKFVQNLKSQDGLQSNGNVLMEDDQNCNYEQKNEGSMKKNFEGEQDDYNEKINRKILRNGELEDQIEDAIDYDNSQIEFDEKKGQNKEIEQDILCLKCHNPIATFPHVQCINCKKQLHLSCRSNKNNRPQQVLYWWCESCRRNDLHQIYMKIINSNKLNQKVMDEQLNNFVESLQSQDELMNNESGQIEDEQKQNKEQETQSQMQKDSEDNSNQQKLKRKKKKNQKLKIKEEQIGKVDIETQSIERLENVPEMRKKKRKRNDEDKNELIKQQNHKNNQDYVKEQNEKKIKTNKQKEKKNNYKRKRESEEVDQIIIQNVPQQLEYKFSQSTPIIFQCNTNSDISLYNSNQKNSQNEMQVKQNKDQKPQDEQKDQKKQTLKISWNKYTPFSPLYFLENGRFDPPENENCFH